MPSKDNVVTSVNAQGTASADYDRARFTVRVEGRGKTVPTAKAAAEVIIAKVRDAIDTLSKKGGVKVDKNSVKSNYSTSPDYEYVKNKNKHVGYLAVYDITFETESLDKASDIQDTLTGINGATTEPVTFTLKESEGLKKIALKDAFTKISDRFATECGVLGKKVDDYQIVSWSTNYGDGRRGGPVGGARAYASHSNMAGAAPENIEVEMGKCEINVNLSVSYARKA